MTPPAAHGAEPGRPPAPDSPLEALRALLAELPGLVADRVRLATLEMRRAGQALALIVALLVAAAVLVSTAWLTVWASVFAALVQSGLAWGWAALAVVALNLAAAALALRRALALGPLLALPATVRQLTGDEVTVPPPGGAPT